MATGRLGTQQLTSGSITTYTNCYQVPVNYYSVLNISLTNTTAVPVTVRVALSTSSSSPSASELIEYGTTIQPNGVFERTGIVLNSGLYVLVSSTSTALNVNVWGIETSTT
jgi:hypothetical protein